MDEMVHLYASVNICIIVNQLKVSYDDSQILQQIKRPRPRP